MKKTFAIIAAAALAASVSTSAFACMYGKMVSTEKSGPITTALNQQPSTPALETQPIVPKPADQKPEAKSDS
ncbi:MAG: hypothetical protein OXI64_05330 [Defluviicoccus sp.]|nr:hypothetical protein [Defluviicoccus sp.]